MKALVGAFNQEKALVGAFSVIVKTDCETDGSFAALGLGLAQLGAEPPRPPAEARVPGDPGAVRNPNLSLLSFYTYFGRSYIWHKN